MARSKPEKDTEVQPAPAPTLEAAAAGRRAAAAETEAADDPRSRMVDSLLVERRGYVTRGKPDRVAQVDEQIRHYGGQPPADSED